MQSTPSRKPATIFSKRNIRKRISDAIRARTYGRAQKRALGRGERGVIAKWVNPTFIEAEEHQLYPPKKSIKGNIKFAVLLALRKAQGINLFPGEIARIARIEVPTQRNKTGVLEVNVPHAKTDWFSFMRSWEGRVAEKKLRKYKTTQKDHLPREVPYDMGINTLLEVGDDGNGNPTHILLTRRPENALLGKSVYDYPGGIYKPGMNAMKVLKDRTHGETGINIEDLETIGPGFKPTTEPIFYALHRNDKDQCYNFVAIQRTRKSPEEIGQIIAKRIAEAKRKKDSSASSGYAFIPRNRKAIEKFLRTHPLFTSEVVAEYAKEIDK